MQKLRKIVQSRVWVSTRNILCYSYTSANSSETSVENHLAFETFVFVAPVLAVAQVSLLSGAHAAAGAPIRDDVHPRLAPEPLLVRRTIAVLLVITFAVAHRHLPKK